jgi:hypothetical protein
MAELVYLLCAILSLVCAGMLLRGYIHSHTQLLLWSALCFAFIAANNTFLFIDLAIFPSLDLHGQLWRNLLSATGGSLLLFGLIWELT